MLKHTLIGLVILLPQDILVADVLDADIMREALKLSKDSSFSQQNFSNNKEVPFTIYEATVKSNKFIEKGKLKIFSQDIEGLQTKEEEGLLWVNIYHLNNIKRKDFIDEVKVSIEKQKGTILYQGQDYIFFKIYKGTILYWAKVVHSRSQYRLEVLEEKPIQVFKKIKNLTLKNIHFDSGKATLQKGSQNEVSRIFNFLNKNISTVVEIQGHTDSSGNSSENLNLSQRRAETIKKALIIMGIEKSRLNAKGYGDTQPIANNKDIEGRRKNRRVIMKIL